MTDNQNLFTVFTDDLPREKKAEGVAVSEAVAFGKCDRCMHLPVCERVKTFKPPSGAFCMVRKAEILEGWKRCEKPEEV